MRCSGDGQVSGDTWDRQSEAIARYASLNQITIAAEFRDEGITGKMELEGRGGLSQCMQYVQANHINTVIVESSDRLARDMIVAEVIVREFQKIDVRVICASGGINLTDGDDSNPTAKLIRQILAAISEFERCCIILKLRSARQRKKARVGKCEGRHSFGEKPAEAQTLEQIREWHYAGSTPKRIAADLNSLNYRSRSGLPWRATTVAKIIRRLEAA
jgi:DNA invertase Pin-like site-specific DNA recombinase